jgi:hypothetical protein
MKKKIAGGVGQGEVDAQVLQKTNKKNPRKQNKTLSDVHHTFQKHFIQFC